MVMTVTLSFHEPAKVTQTLLANAKFTTIEPNVQLRLW